MLVAFRVDASLQIGTGHVMRCLALAQSLTARGARCVFICRKHEGHLASKIKNFGFELIELPNIFLKNNKLSDKFRYENWLGCDALLDANQSTTALLSIIGHKVDWLIVDHYGIDHKWEKAMRRITKKIMCIDDLANRQHDCDLLLDQTLGRIKQDYSNLTLENSEFLLGPKYALLRTEFIKCRGASLKRRLNPTLKNILITMGGIDKDDITSNVLCTLNAIKSKAIKKIIVVLGSNAPFMSTVQTEALKMNINTQVMTDVSNIAQLMTKCDLVIGAAGSTTWERCSLGVPSIQIVIADNQKVIAERMEKAGAALTCLASDLDTGLPTALAKINQDQNLYKMANAAAEITDGAGTSRVVEYVYGS